VAASLILSGAARLLDDAGIGRPRAYATELFGAIDFSTALRRVSLPCPCKACVAPCRYVSRPKIILHIVKCLLRSSSEIFCYSKTNFTI
jgi:hypothetical protein